MENRKVTFIGSGNMSRSIISGLTASGFSATNITATDPNEEQRDLLTSLYGIHTEEDNHIAAEEADVIVLAIKPQIMELVCGALTDIDFSNKLVISIAQESQPND